jgi:transcriptional regulator with XRE-family HTH domain
VSAGRQDGVVDDRTTGLVLRALRRRRGWRQTDLAAKAGVSPSSVSRAERGWLDQLALRTIRGLFGAVEARVMLAPRWRGAEPERLLDEDHAVIVELVARRLERMGWLAYLEVTYSEYGERGSIDVLGLRAAARAVVVVEVKTDVASVEAVGRKVDEKARLAPVIVKARFGWTPVVVGRVVVMPDTMRLRRLVQRHEAIGRMFPVDAHRVRAWLRAPVGEFAGLWFLSDSHQRTTRGPRASSARRIRPTSVAAHAQRDGSDASAPAERGSLGSHPVRR